MLDIHMACRSYWNLKSTKGHRRHWHMNQPMKKFGFRLVYIFINEKLMVVREGRQILFLFFLFGCYCICLLSSLCSESISGLSFICSNIYKLNELHICSDLPRHLSSLLFSSYRLQLELDLGNIITTTNFFNVLSALKYFKRMNYTLCPLLWMFGEMLKGT